MKELIKGVSKVKKAVTHCVDCNKKLSKNAKHHWRCHSCWVALNKEKK